MFIGYQHWLILGSFMVATWLLVTYMWPRLMLSVFKRGILTQGIGEGPIPVNTLSTEPQELFTDPLHPPASASRLVTTGVNHDTLATAGWLDLRNEPLVLHVPDMHDRYYSMQFTDPSKNTVFAYVGKRTTGTQTGDYLITGPGWKAMLPQGVKQVSSPNNAVLLLGRVLVESDSDVATAYELSKQIQLTPLSQWKAGQ